MSARPHRRLDPEARRRQLVDAGRELFARAGYDAVGLEEVAQAAGVRRGLIYRYFPAGKSDLYHAVVEDSWCQLVARVDTAPERALSAKLPRNVAVFLDLAEEGHPALVIAWQSRRVPEARVQAIARDARRTFARGIASNHLGTDEPPEALVTALAGYLAMSEHLIEEWRLHRTLDRSQLEALLREMLPPIVEIARAAVGRATSGNAPL